MTTSSSHARGPELSTPQTPGSGSSAPRVEIPSPQVVEIPSPQVVEIPSPQVVENPSPQVAAFFDVDHTLIACNSARKWVEYLWRNGKISAAAALRSVWWLVKYRLSVLDYEQVTSEVVRDYGGQSVDELGVEVEEWFHRDVEPMICVEGRDRVEWHRAQGHVLVMLTSGTFFSVAPLQRILDIPHLVCTQLEIADGKLTGKYFPPSCFGPGKLRAGLAFATDHGIDLARSYFYTDSYSDLPMLERVGHPCIVNPDPRLKHWAAVHHMQWQRWHPQGT